jgi:cyclohexanecarboxyl-CoA dehydrogenase
LTGYVWAVIQLAASEARNAISAAGSAGSPRRPTARSRYAESMLDRSRSEKFPTAELAELGDAGLLGLRVSESLGGQGGDVLAVGIAVEQLAYADPVIAYLAFAANISNALLAKHGSDEVCDRWLSRGIAGEAVMCLALTEPGAGSDAANLDTRAVRVDGGWRISGEKTSITQAVHADLAMVVAQTDPKAGAKGIGMFLVDMDDPAVTTQTIRDPGFKPVGRGSIFLDGVFVPDSHVLGGIGRGFGLVMHEFDLSRTLIALMNIGTAQRALDMAIEYSKQRKTFGRPLAANQGVPFVIAEHSTYVSVVRALGYHALGLRMAGRPHTSEAAMLKWWGPLVAFNAIRDCIVLHGQVGWSEEMPLQAMLRDVSGCMIGDGTPQIQKLVIARELIGKEVLAR